MKKISLCLMTVLLSLTFMPTLLKASSEKVPSSSTAPLPDAATRANTLLTRLNEIRTMDKSDLNASEKRQLRKEVRTSSKQLREIQGGVYISVGAIIIIILLLILLL